MKSQQGNQSSPSRRERPAKPALTRQGIIDSALTILRDEGLNKVTMRRIATALDTGAASLYVYIQNTEDLHAQILDALLGAVQGPVEIEGTWRDRLKDLLTRYLLILIDYPEMARMAMSTQPSGPNYLALVDTILALLREGCVPDRDAAWAVDLLLLFATSTAAEQGNRLASSRSEATFRAEFSALHVAIAAASAESYPEIARLGDELVSGGPIRFQWGLDVLLAGILATPRPGAGTDAG